MSFDARIRHHWSIKVAIRTKQGQCPALSVSLLGTQPEVALPEAFFAGPADRAACGVKDAAPI